MEGDTGKTKQPSVSKSDVAFHSENIADTKAKEKRKVFVHVSEEKKTIKQTAEEFQKKFEEARIRNQKAAELARSKIKKRFSKRTIITFFVSIVVLITGGAVAYYLIKNPQLTDPSLAAFLKMQENFDAGYNEFQKLISNTKDPKKEAELYIKRGYASLKTCGKSCLSKITDDANKAETTHPSADSALLYHYIEQTRGYPEAAETWLAISESRGKPSSWWKTLDSWSKKNGAKHA